MKAFVIGLGVGAEHARAYTEEGLDVTVWDSDPAKMALTPYDKARAPSEGLYEADIVSVCTPDDTHFQMATEALNKGKYVVIEKPPCLARDEMEFLEGNDSRLYCNLPLPFHFSNLLDEFKEKSPYLIEMDYLWGRHHKLVEGWRASNGYSIVLGAGLHMLHLMLHFKDAMPEDGASMGGNKSGVNAPFDCVQTLFKWTDGTLGRVGINCGFEGDHEHRIAVYTKDYHRVVSNKDPVDKTAGIRDFLNRINSGEPVDNSKLWNAMRLCFELEAAANA